MEVAAFAADRRERLTAGDDAIRPAVEGALVRRANGETTWWAPIVTAASQIWLEHHQAEAPGANYAAAMQRFRESLAESLSKTSEQTNTERITRWASTMAVNAGTISGAAAARVTHKMWLTMDDEDVREIHRPLDGVIVPMGSTFNVAGSRLPYPGVPIGPPEGWIECRCVAMPAARRGEAMSMSTFAMETESDDTLANPDGAPYTGALVVLVPAADDPVVAASSEPAHLTTIWFGELADLPVDAEELEQAVRQYAQDLDGPVVVPVAERGTLGDDDADVAFLEKTDSLGALRDGLLANESVKAAYDAAEQFPEWTPHVTLGYPDRPARGEYDATEVTFDRISLWLGGEHFDYPMGGTVSDTITADAAVAEAEVDEEIVTDEPEEGEELITEIPVHGVATLEGRPTGDGRGFRPGAISFGRLPAPLGYEFESGHGSDNSRVTVVGRIDEFWTVPHGDEEGVFEVRWRGVILPSYERAGEALSHIIDGSYDGLSVIVDAMGVDAEFSEQQEVADGTIPVTWFKSARVRRFDMVPTGAFQEGYVALGSQFEDEMTDEDREAAVAALTACGCLDGVVDLSTEPLENWRAAAEAEDGAYRQYDAAERKRMAGNGTAMPDGSFPIADEEDLRNAIQSVGRASDQDAARAHIKKRATALGKTNLIPQDWAADADAFAPGTHDGPGWITHPVPTARIRRYWTRGKGAAKIGWGTPGDFNRCRAQLAKYVQNPEWLAGLCANMHKEALGFWPAQHHGARSLVASGAQPAPLMSLVAAASGESFRFPAEYFSDPKFKGVTPLTIDKETRRVYGHLAQWKSCHIGINGACERPPHSASGYANFLKGVIDTDQGEVSVGTLTYGIGHANPMMRAAAATAHYDQTDAVFAFVAVGEDAYGIWYSGVLRASVDDDTVDDIRAIGALSGDWRRFPRFGLDLVAAVSVNTPGYSLAASAGTEWDGHGDLQMSALGLGVVEPEVEHSGETHEEFAARLVDMAVARIRRDERMSALRARSRALRLTDARARAERIG